MVVDRKTGDCYFICLSVCMNKAISVAGSKAIVTSDYQPKITYHKLSNDVISWGSSILCY